MRILIVVPRQERSTGNWISAERFRQGLEARGHHVTIRDTPLQAEDSLREALLTDPPDVALLLHAYRSGLPWLQAATGLGIPYAVMLTGTDVNQGLDDPRQSPVIRAVLDQAAMIVHQNPLLGEKLVSYHPCAAARLRHVAAGVVLGGEPCDLRQELALPTDRVLCLCAAGIRPVKGLVELLELFDRAGAERWPLTVAFCGPILDPVYAERFLEAVARRPWAHYLGVIPPGAMAAAMSSVDVILNNSTSEGLSNVLLEATVLGRPILARDIPGNAAIVEHGVNGMLYDDASFAACLRDLALNPQHRKALARPNPARFDPVREGEQLAELLRQACRGKFRT